MLNKKLILIIFPLLLPYNFANADIPDEVFSARYVSECRPFHGQKRGILFVISWVKYLGDYETFVISTMGKLNDFSYDFSYLEGIELKFFGPNGKEIHSEYREWDYYLTETSSAMRREDRIHFNIKSSILSTAVANDGLYVYFYAAGESNFSAWSKYSCRPPAANIKRHRQR